MVDTIEDNSSSSRETKNSCLEQIEVEAQEDILTIQIQPAHVPTST